ncbi:MAG: DUF2213 domain-containing protein, partial [Vallitaleaceae bacterium]|nr:DUF2213 domain-containing protein [Vallitaleaceae bacterium]
SREMKTVQRFEEAEVLDYVENEEDGFLTVEIAATRTGVMPYYDWDTGEVVMELKPPEEIFSDMTMNSLKGVPVTDRHPPVMVDSKNWIDFTKGTTHQDVRKEDNLLVISETIFDDNLIAYVKSGKKAQVSIGFRAYLEEEGGEFEGEQYDRIQRNIRINHIAHVEQGRAGEDVKVRLDSKEEKLFGYSKKEEVKDMDYMKVENFWDGLGTSTAPDFDIYTTEDGNEKLDSWLNDYELPIKEVEVEKEDGVDLEEYEIGDSVISVKKEDVEKLDNFISEKEEMQGKLDSKDDEISALKERMDKLENKDIDSIVQKRLDLVDSVREFIDGYDANGKSEKEIKADLISEIDKEFELENKSDEYVNARFDGAMKTLKMIKSDSIGSNNLKFKKEDKKDKYKDKKDGRLNLKK